MTGAVVLVLGLLAGCQDDDGPAAGRVTPSAQHSVAPTDGFEWRPVAPVSVGLDPVALSAIAREARRADSDCFLVARRGRIAAEWSWPRGSAPAPTAAFSVTKSVTSTLVGIAQADGDLDVDDRAARYVPEWRGTPAARVTVRDLLSNDSGRYWSSRSDYRDLIVAEDRTAYAVGLRQQSPPGRTWQYNNAAIQTLDAVLRAATGVPTDEYAEQRLFGPLGMTDTRMTNDASGRSTNTFFGLETTCRDLARLGLLFARGGRWQGEQLVPRGWIRRATGRASQRLNRGYGLLWWLNREESLVPDGPRDAYAALGLGGQVLLVDPGSDVVVVRLGAIGDYSVADAGRVLTEALDTR